MASIYKDLKNSDVASTRTLLYEAIPLTGSIVSGTYGTDNIKNYAHGMFQSVYDYPYLSSSANHIFDITVGYPSTWHAAAPSNILNTKKINIYNEMAQVLVGYDKLGNVQKFDQDGDFYGTTTDKLEGCFILPLARLLTKDEIKKGSFQLELGVAASYTQNGAVFANRIGITDASGSDSYFVNSPAGEYGILYATSSANYPMIAGSHACGLIYYQAGVAVITGSVFMSDAAGGLLDGVYSLMNSDGQTFEQMLTGSTISGSADSIRNRFYDLQFNNTVELNSTIYFCRANHNEFNYSANPTYLSGSTINVKTDNTNPPLSYITTVGLYSADNQLLAVGKLSEPLKKDPTVELTLRTRLDY